MLIENLRKIGKPLFYFPQLAIRLGDVKTAVFISLFIYWDGKTDDGWVYRRQKDISNDTGLSRFEQEGARKTLQQLGILKEKRKGVPAQVYYKFDWVKVEELFVMPLTQEKMPADLQQAVHPTVIAPIIGETKDLLTWKMRKIFEEEHQQHYPKEPYAWKKGRDDKHMKNISIVIFTKLTIQKKDREIFDEDVLDSFRQFLRSLPEYHVKNSFTPGLLDSRYQNIRQQIVNEKKQSVHLKNENPDYGKTSFD